MINLGRNVMDFWPYFAVELGLPWDIWAWEIHGPSWTGTGSLMASVFCRTDLQGTLLSGGRWTPRRVATMDGFGIIESEDALFWIGEMGGTLSHVEHPHGTLVQIPKTLEVAAGALLNVEPEAVFGKPPYTVSLGVPSANMGQSQQRGCRDRCSCSRESAYGPWASTMSLSSSLMRTVSPTPRPGRSPSRLQLT